MIVSKKIIWFVNKDAAPIEDYGTHLRTVKQAQFFQDKGYDVKLICSAQLHNSSKNYLEGSNSTFIEKQYDNIPFLFIKTKQYKNNGLKRILSYIQFSFLLFIKRNTFPKPDIIVHTSRIPFDLLIYYTAKRLKAKYILDITDLWPMVFDHFGYLSKKNPILKLFYSIEKKLYSSADHVVFSMEGANDYITEKKWDISNGGSIDLNKVHYINNGVDLESFNRDLLKFKIEDEDLENDKLFKIIYLGSIRFANNLEQIINAAKILQNYSEIVFLIYGDGNEREELEKICIDNKLDNVKFKQKWIEPQYVPYVLSKASLNLLNYNPGLGKYGGSMNKMFLSFASGKPICCNVGFNYSLIKKNNLGIDKYFSSAEEYADAILSIVKMDKILYDDMCERVRNTANDYDYNELCRLFAEYCDI